MRASKEAAADRRPRRASDGKYPIAFFFAHRCEYHWNNNSILWRTHGATGKTRPQFPTRPLIDWRSQKVGQPIRDRSIRASSKGDSKKSVRRVRKGLGESELGMSKHDSNGQTNRGSSIRTRP